jgi:hypothetical protein
MLGKVNVFNKFLNLIASSTWMRFAQENESRNLGKVCGMVLK